MGNLNSIDEEVRARRLIVYLLSSEKLEGNYLFKHGKQQYGKMRMLHLAEPQLSNVLAKVKEEAMLSSFRKPTLEHEKIKRLDISR